MVAGYQSLSDRVLGAALMIMRKVERAVEDNERSKPPMAGHLGAGFSANATSERSNFGLTWNAVLETGGVPPSDDVNIELELQAFPSASAE
jgi:polyisoprenoid-binding protein YceI